MSNGLKTVLGLDVQQDCPAFPHLPEYVRLVGGATLTGSVLPFFEDVCSRH